MKPSAIAHGIASVVLTAAVAAPVFAADNVVHTIDWTVGAGNWGGHAATVSASSVEYLPGSGHLHSKSGDVYAGEFDVTYNGSKPFEAVCTDLFRDLNFGKDYSTWTVTSAASLFGADRATALGKLWTVAHDHVVPDSHGSMANSAAFQLAVWEIVYEKKDIKGDLHFDLTAGAFKGSNGALSVAQGWLAAIQDPTKGVAVTSLNVLHSLGGGKVGSADITQDLLVPVPEPETYAMFLAGLGLMGAVARRRAFRRQAA